MSVQRLEVPPVIVSEAMLDLARSLRQTADAIEKGEIRGVAICTVASGPEMYVTREFAVMSGAITLTGGVYRLLQEVSQA